MPPAEAPIPTTIDGPERTVCCGSGPGASASSVPSAMFPRESAAIQKRPPPAFMLLDEIVRTSSDVASASGRLAKIGLLAGLLRRLTPAEIDIAIPLLSGELRQGRIGLGPATIWAARPPIGARCDTDLAAVDETFARIAGTTGAGSAGTRQTLLGELLQRATSSEQDFLDAGAGRRAASRRARWRAARGRGRAASVPAADSPRGDAAGALAPVARAALLHGGSGAVAFDVLCAYHARCSRCSRSPRTISMPPSIASVRRRSSGSSMARASRSTRPATRCACSRATLRDVTPAVPEVVERRPRLPAASDLRRRGDRPAPDGTPHPFQVTMRRFGRGSTSIAAG